MLHETDLATPPPKPGPFQYLIRSLCHAASPIRSYKFEENVSAEKAKLEARLAELNAQLGFFKKG